MSESRGTKTVHVAVYDTFADWEIGYATAHIANGRWHREPNAFRVVTVGPTLEPVTTMGGLRITPDITLAELRPADSAMLILAGADTWADGTNAAFAAKARELLDAGVPVAGICGATFGLAVEGLLDDRKHTSNAAEYLAMSGYKGGDRHQQQTVVTDGDLVTASAVAPVDFARAIFERLGVYEPGVLASWYKLYGDHDAAGYFELMAV